MYRFAILKQYKDMFQGAGRQFTIDEPVRFYLRNIPAAQLEHVIVEMQSKGYTIESIEAQEA